MREEDCRVVAGQFSIGEIHWSFVARDDVFDLWSHAEDVGVPDLSAASRHLRTLHDTKPSAIRVRTVPAPYEALSDLMTWNDLRTAYDAGLKHALRVLGSDATNYDTGGMPSEYRGWMAYASEEAQRFISRTRAASEGEDRVMLANEIIMGASSVAFSTRYGHTTLPFTMAVALVGLRERMKGT